MLEAAIYQKWQSEEGVSEKLKLLNLHAQDPLFECVNIHRRPEIGKGGQKKN